MSEKINQTKKLEEEVVVNNMETISLVNQEKEAKKAKAISIAKKVGILAGVGILGFVLGRKTSGNDDYDDYDDSEVIEVESEVISDEE